jgi:hypothetical protein
LNTNGFKLLLLDFDPFPLMTGSSVLSSPPLLLFLANDDASSLVRAECDEATVPAFDWMWPAVLTPWPLLDDGE